MEAESIGREQLLQEAYSQDYNQATRELVAEGERQEQAAKGMMLDRCDFFVTTARKMKYSILSNHHWGMTIRCV
jgi:hypothetical protein